MARLTVLGCGDAFGSGGRGATAVRRRATRRSDVVAQRPRLRCRRLLLTHLGAELLAHRDEIPFEVAEDGMVVELGTPGNSHG